MKRSKVKPGSVALAIILAGPIVAIVSFAGEWFGLTAGSSRNALGYATQIVPVLVLSTLVGSAVAVLPCMIGAAIMSAWGRGNEAMRMPVMWALTGGGLAGLPTALATTVWSRRR